MSFLLLKQVISYLRKTSRCPGCQAKYTEDDVFVLATNDNPDLAVHYGLFAVECLKCESASLVMIEARDTHECKIEFKTVENFDCQDGSSISINEVLDMRNFLKQWKGDVKELFKEGTV